MSSDRASKLSSLSNDTKDIMTEETITSEPKSEKKVWTEFLNNLHDSLSKYEIQRNVTKLEGIPVNQSNAEIFFKKVASLKLQNHNAVASKKSALSDSELEELNKVLGSTLKSPEIKKKCVGSYSIVEAKFISVRNLLEKSYLTNDCRYSSNRQSSPVTAILALDTIFIDADLILPEQRLVLIAPNWEVVGVNRTIDLSGSDGAAIVEDSRCELPGKKGKPGLPGGSGGVFLGIGERFVNGRGLRVLANGGRGGPGEDGCPGRKGPDGAPAEVDSNAGCSEDFCQTRLNRKFRCNVSSCKTGASYSNPFFGNYPVQKSDCCFKIIGQPGDEGTPGGDGGRGGWGGNPGFVVLLELDGQKSEVLAQTEPGRDGDSGLGGRGGLGGKNGDNLQMICSTDSRKLSTTVLKRTDRAASGSNGAPGANDRFIKDRPKVAPLDNPSDVVGEYKAYLRYNLLTDFKGPELTAFLKRLDGNPKVRRTYHLLGLFGEHSTLERQTYELKMGVGFVPFYRSLLAQIDDFSKRISTLTRSENELNQYKNALNYLYKAVSRRIDDLGENLESFLITSVQNDLLDLKKEVDELKRYRAEKNKADLAERKRKEDRINIAAQIKEAKNLINNEIEPKIEEINADIESKIVESIEDLSRMIKRQELEGKVLERKKTELQRQLKWKIIVDVVSFASKSLAFLGPAGAIAGGILDGSNSFLESSLTNSDEFLKTSSLALNHLDKIRNSVSSIMNDKVRNFKSYLSDVTQELNSKKELYGEEIFHKVSSVKERLAKIDVNVFNVGEIQVLQSELNQDLRNLENRLKVSDDDFKTGDGEVQKVKDYLANTGNLLSLLRRGHQFGQIVVDQIKKYRNDQGRLKAIDASMAMNEASTENLKVYQRNIVKSMTPVINGIQDDFHRMRDEMGTKSKVGLDVTKWRVQDKLKEMQLEMQGLTKNSELADELKKSVENLDSTLSTLIQVYKDVQDYQYQLRVSELIAEFSTIQANRMSVLDQEVGEAINESEMLIRSNSILEQFMASYDAFKRLVFPFAERYLKQIKLPRGLVLTDDLDDKAREVVDQIESMIENLDRYRSLRRIDGNSMGDGRFDSSGVSSRPFYVWKEQKDVSELLAGKEVALVADVSSSGIEDRDAIKFRDLSLEFKSGNAERQAELNEILRAFRINMRHTGDSYYRYGKDVYAIPTKQYGIWYELDFEPATGKPKSKSQEYEDIRRGDYALSPYGTWRLKLDNLPNFRNVSFDNLKAFSQKNEVYLELSGNASFVVRGENDSGDLRLSEYYRYFDGDASDDNLEEAAKTRISDIYERTQVASDSGYENDSQGSWFTWKLPNFSIIPGAEAFSTEEIGMLNRSPNRELYYEFNYTNDDIGESKIEPFGLDNANLVMAQLVAARLFGPNRALNNYTGYVSLEDQRTSLVKLISAKVKSSLSIFEDRTKDFIDNYNSSPKWYQNIFKNELKTPSNK